MTKEEAVSFLKHFMHEISTQDNRATASPYFYVVRREMWRVAHDDFHSGETKSVWVYPDGDYSTHTSKQEFADFMRKYDESLTPEDIEAESEKLVEYTLEAYYEDENVFFTEKGYHDHMRLNGHNLSGAFSYVKYAFRNVELENMFAAIRALIHD